MTWATDAGTAGKDPTTTKEPKLLIEMTPPAGAMAEKNTAVENSITSFAPLGKYVIPAAVALMTDEPAAGAGVSVGAEIPDGADTEFAVTLGVVCSGLEPDEGPV